ncbi:MAG: helix-turn-helix transcriptional regulator [Bacteroidales bacterium]
MKQLDKLNSISTPDTTWRKDALYRKANREWLMNSAKIALVILRAIKNCSMTQKELAERMGVKPQQISKIVKGKENLTLETIGKLEKALNLKIVDIKFPV